VNTNNKSKRKTKESEIKFLDSSTESKDFGDVQITGSVSGSSIQSGTVNASQIAAGDNNAYFVQSSHKGLLIGESLSDYMKKFVEDENLSSNDEEYLIKAIQQIEKELESDKPDERMLSFFLNSIKKISPAISKTLITRILGSFDSSQQVTRLLKGLLEY